ncbi:uncharacterized protein LOC141648228 [Silene latifolia]|uniref:uncharacterized protein LOC141648228 n=1 Tax=Silene latifolia TaxID=37657 RepID=UPI003D774D3F
MAQMMMGKDWLSGKHLKEMKIKYQGPWCVCGDFNSVLNFNERIGREVQWAEIAVFRDCVAYCGSVDIKGQGTFYTWNNKQIPSSRGFLSLYRFMVNSECIDLYPDSYAHFLLEGLFDHNPCVCHRRTIREKKKSTFHYYNMWSLSPDFKSVVQTFWHQPVAGTLMYQLVSKLKALKNPLKQLNRNGFSDIEKSVGVAKALLEELKIQMHQNPTDHSLLAAEREAAASYRRHCRLQHSFFS